MTQSIPAESKPMSNEATRNQRLMELIEAEDAANGEVGCGQYLGRRVLGYVASHGTALDDEKLRSLLREHLGHILRDPDFDSITTQIQRQIESLVDQAPSKSLSSELPLALAKVTEHIPTGALKDLFQSYIAEFCSESALEQLIQFSHQVIHKAVLNPRHTWPKPIWVLRGAEQIYIAQGAEIEEVIAKIRTQHPHETGRLEIIKVGGILAPDQVIALDTDLL